MPAIWVTVQRIATAVSSSPAGTAAINNTANWIAAGYLATVSAYLWFGPDEPPKVHDDVLLPWEDMEPIHCTAHPYWDCYTPGSGEGCLGRSV